MKRLYDTPQILLTLTVLFWSGNFLVGKAVAGEVPPVALAFWRWVIGLAILLPFAWPQLKRDWPAVRAGWKAVLLLAFLGVASFNTLVYIGLHTTTAVNASMLQSAMPACTMAVAVLVFADRVGRAQIAGMLLSLAGVLAIVARGDIEVLLALRLAPGDLLVLWAIVSYAGYTACLRLRPAVHPLTFLAVTFAPGSLMLAPLYLAEIASGTVMRADMATFGAILYVAVFPSILAYLCYNRGVELLGPSRANQFIHLQPMFVAVAAVLLLGERFEWFHAAGIAAILAGLVIANRAPARAG
ncbi:MAG: DMT family transporter [Thalassobaculales bacterium]